MREYAQRWVFGGVAVAYAALILSLVPWASDPGYDTPYLIAIYGITICLADMCTVLFLARRYRRDGQAYQLAILAAYLFGALLSMPLALSFPEAFGPGRVFGHETTSAILFLSWHLGCALLLLVGVMLGIGDARPIDPQQRDRWMAFVIIGVVPAGYNFPKNARLWTPKRAGG